MLIRHFTLAKGPAKAQTLPTFDLLLEEEVCFAQRRHTAHDDERVRHVVAAKVELDLHVGPLVQHPELAGRLAVFRGAEKLDEAERLVAAPLAVGVDIAEID